MSIQIALGLRDAGDVSQESKVEVLSNKSVEGKIQRHLKMAQMLHKKGMVDLAKAQYDTAYQLDPNSIDTSLVIGQFYCQTGQYKEALEIAEAVKPVKNKDKAIRLLILARSNRGLEKNDIAVNYLIQADKLSSDMPEIYYELGIIYQMQGDLEKAVLAYRRALDMILGQSEAKASPDL